MAIFHNRPDIFHVLFRQDKQNFVFSLVISVCLMNREIIYSKTYCFESVFFIKCRHFFVTEFHRGHRLRGNNEF